MKLGGDSGRVLGQARSAAGMTGRRPLLGARITYASRIQPAAKKLLRLACGAVMVALEVLRNPVPSASLESFGDSALEFALHVHVPDPSLAGRVRHRLATEIQRRFQEAGIEIPKPGREVHVRSLPREWPLSHSSITHPVRLDPPAPTPPPPVMTTVAAEPETEDVIHRCVDE